MPAIEQSRYKTATPPSAAPPVVHRAILHRRDEAQRKPQLPAEPKQTPKQEPRTWPK